MMSRWRKRIVWAVVTGVVLGAATLCVALVWNQIVFEYLLWRVEKGDEGAIYALADSSNEKQLPRLRAGIEESKSEAVKNSLIFVLYLTRMRLASAAQAKGDITLCLMHKYEAQKLSVEEGEAPAHDLISELMSDGRWTEIMQMLKDLRLSVEARKYLVSLLSQEISSEDKDLNQKIINDLRTAILENR